MTKTIDEKLKNLEEKEAYAEKFKAFGLDFTYDYDEISIKPFDDDQDEYVTFIYLDRKETSTDQLDTFLKRLELGRRIEKQTVFKLSNFVDNLTFIHEDGGNTYIMTISDGCLCNLQITKTGHKVTDNYHKTFDNDLTIVIKSDSYNDFSVSWEYKTVTAIGGLVSEIEKGMLRLIHA